MRGWRHGWSITPETLVEPLEHLAEGMLFGSLAFIQVAGLVAPTHELPEVEGMRAPGFESAVRLLASHGVSVLPGEAFGPSAGGFVRVSLTVNDELLSPAEKYGVAAVLGIPGVHALEYFLASPPPACAPCWLATSSAPP